MMISFTPSLKKEILIVEDSLCIQGILQRSLTCAGFVTVTSSDGQKTLDILAQRKNPFYAVLMDLKMPKLDGKACIKALRKMGKLHATVPVIAVTGNDGDYTEDKLKAMGFNEVVFKPIDFPLLFQLLNKF